MKKTERDGLYFLEQDGPELGWSEASGVELIEQDGQWRVLPDQALLDVLSGGRN